MTTPIPNSSHDGSPDGCEDALRDAVHRHLVDLVDARLAASGPVLADAAATNAHPRLTAEIPADVLVHSRDCSSCSRIVAAATRQAALLRRLPRPSLPAAMKAADFLDSIAERAAEPSERFLEPLLRASLPPVAAPRDASWVEVPLRVVRGRDALGDGLAALAERHRAPSRLWGRVRTELDAFRRERAPAPRRAVRGWMRVTVIAAAAVVVAWIVPSPFENRGTSPAPEFVLVPIPSSDLPSLVAQQSLFDLIDRVRDG